MNRHLCALLVALACFGGCLPANTLLAHEVRPALLELSELQESNASRFETLWKLPRTGELTLRLSPKFPSTCTYSESPLPHVLPSAFVYTGLLECQETLRGQSIGVAGLESTLTDALVRIDFASGESFDTLLRAAAPSQAIPERGSVGVPAYLQLGFTHMLLGVDHLLFVLGLLLLIVPSAVPIRAKTRLVDLERSTLLTLTAAVTSFTLAHSITLALAVLGHATLPQAPVEAVIAMSIVLLASEIARDTSRQGLVSRRPWQMAFAFGLLHGFGFAGALADIGLPQAQVGWALLLFNLGIEAGQLAFISCALGLYFMLGGWIARLPNPVRALPVFAIGAIASYWTLGRVSLMLF